MAKLKAKAQPKKKKSTKAKTPSTKRKKQSPKPAQVSSSRLSRLEDLQQTLNKKLAGKGSILLGSQIKELEFQKIRTGNLAKDYVLNGGLIRGRITQYWGVEGSSKTSSLAHDIRYLQSQGMLCALAPVEGFDKAWFRNIGVYIPYSDAEMDNLSRGVRKDAEKYNIKYQDLGWAPFALIQHRAGDELLQLVLELTKGNSFDYIGIDSLGAVVSSRILEERDIADEDERGGEARLFNRFQRFMQAAFNMSYDADGNPDTKGAYSNRTVIVAINQARVTMNSRAMRREKQFHPTGGQGLKHFWSQSLFFDHIGSEDQADMVPYDGVKRRDVYAKTFRVVGTKMRGGPPDREARYTLHVKDHRHEDLSYTAGQVDNFGTARALGVMLGVVDRSGAYYEFQGERIKGKDNFEKMLINEPGLYQDLYDKIIEKAVLDSSAGKVPDV